MSDANTTSHTNGTLLFLWEEEFEEGVFMLPELYEFADTFTTARHSCETWGELMSSIGEFGRLFVEPFLTNDLSPDRPQPLQKLSELEDVWVLEDEEFPWTQCVQESYTKVAPALTSEYAAVQIWTEYGVPVSYFKKADYLALCTDLAEAGFLVEPKLETIPKLINYGRPRYSFRKLA